jgi:OmpA-OmpF porin, OOP family
MVMPGMRNETIRDRAEFPPELRNMERKGLNNMQGNRKSVLWGTLTFCLLVSVWAFGGDKTKVKGLIIDRTADSLTLKTDDGTKTTVALDDDTKVQHPRGLGIRKKQVSAAVLIPGLKVSVEGETNDQGQVAAKTITFDSNDLETAEMIQAGLHPTAEQVATNQNAIGENQQAIAGQKVQLASQKQDIDTNQQAIANNKQAINQNIQDIQQANDRFDSLSQYDVKGDLTIHFKSGSSKLAADDESQLKQLAQSASGLKGYIIEVKGYADSTGNAAMNTELSQDRAQAVINCLVQQGGVSVRHIVAPGAYGETNAVASNENASGRAENRRVEVKVLVNKGVAGT